MFESGVASPALKSNRGKGMDAERIYQFHELMRGRRTALPMAAIVEQMACSKRTVKRVTRFMRDHLRAPLEFDREYGGYRYRNESYELPGLWFSATEMLALLSLQKLLGELGPGLLDAQLAPFKTRIENILQSEHLNDAGIQRIRLLRMSARISDHTCFQTVAGALLHRRQLHITYHARGDNSETVRTVSPQRLVHYRDNWHLDAWCHERQALRTFALDRIRAARMLEDRATDIPEAQLDAHYADGYGIFAGEARHTAILRFTPERARWIADETWHPRQQGQWLDTGEYELRIPYADPRELVMDILRHVPEVEVVATENLRREVLARLLAGLEKHQPPRNKKI